MIDYFTEPVPHDEAAERIKEKAVVTREVFDELPDDLKARAFVVTGIEDFDVLQALRDRIAELPEGADWDDVKADVVDGLSPWMTKEGAERRANILMRHHGFSAYAAAQARVMDEMIEVFPYRQYISTDDAAVRPSHAALNGIVLPARHSFWEKHTPPWEWNCRCDVVELTEIDMEEERSRDQKRKPEDRRVLEGAALKQLDTGFLNRGLTINVDVRTPKERGGTYENNVRLLNIPLDQIEKRWSPETRKDFKTWASKVRIGGGDLLSWMTGQPVTQKPSDQKSKNQNPYDRKSPVSRSVEVTYKRRAHVASVKAGLEAVDEVHDDGALPRIPVKGSAGRSLGLFNYGKDKHIAIKSTGSWPALTTVHEVGHFLDYDGIGKAGRFETEKGGLLDVVIARIRKTKSMEQMHATPGINHKYFADPREMWARAYAQYVATRSSKPRLRAELKRVRESFQPWRQWSDEEFEPIANEIDKVFEKLKWNPKKK